MCFDDLSLIRYYLKERAFHGTLVQEEEAEVRVLKATPQADNLFDVCVCGVTLILLAGNLQEQQAVGERVELISQTSGRRTHETCKGTGDTFWPKSNVYYAFSLACMCSVSKCVSPNPPPSLCPLPPHTHPP